MDPKYGIGSTSRWSLFLLIAACSVTALPQNSSATVPNYCAMTKRSFIDSGLGTHHLYAKITRDPDLRICSSDKTCCKRAAEEEIHRQGMDSFKTMSKPIHDRLQHAFHNSSEQFVDFLVKLINNSYNSLDLMFSTTYQDRYEKNKHVFQDLFAMLKLYVLGDDVDLKQLCENFFALLYQKVYILFSPQFQYSRAYEACILETSDMIKPFGDEPRKVTLQISRSFLATRVFMEGLQTGRSVVRELLKLKSGHECRQAFTKMLRCASCSGLDGVRPCYKYCLNVMKGCYAYLAVVNKEWTDFISAMLKLAHKLEGPFSVESIVEPLGVKISEAIMVYQDHKDNITSMVSRACGQPPIAKFDATSSGKDKTRVARKAPADFPFEFLGNGPRTRPTTAAGTSFDRLLRDAKATLEPLKDYWSRMAYNVCASGIAEDPSVDTTCWNGIDTSGYKLPVVTDGIPGMFDNPEVSLSIKDPKMVVRAQSVKLKIMTSRILTAVHGSDSSEVDVEEGSGNEASGSGEGSGVGSGGSGLPPTDMPTMVTTAPCNDVNCVEGINGGTTTQAPTSTGSNENVIPENGNNVFNNGFPQTNANLKPRGSGAFQLVSSHSLLAVVLVNILLLL